MKRGLAPSIMDYAKIQSKQVSGISAILCAAKIGTAPEIRSRRAAVAPQKAKGK